MTNHSASKAFSRSMAKAFLTTGPGHDLPQTLRGTLADNPDLRHWAWLDTAEEAVSRREAWAREVGAIFAEATRDAFRAAEQSVREERAAAVRFEDEMRQREGAQ